ncbi:MAG: hypothetical protein J6J29_05150 [Paludibacteraceae bacterium]|nr:hypothetical protein [Paludibacteraceae bacterium]
MKRILIILLLCVGSFIHAQEYQLSEIEDIAYTFLVATPQYAPGVDGNPLIREILSIEAISRDSTNYMCIANIENSSGF